MEKVITIYDVSKMDIVGILVVNEIELGYIEDKIIFYGTDKIKRPIFEFLSSFDKKHINTRDLNKIVAYTPKIGNEIQNLHFLESFEVKSSNKNRSSRHNRMLERMNLTHFERSDFVANQT